MLDAIHARHAQHDIDMNAVFEMPRSEFGHLSLPSVPVIDLAERLARLDSLLASL